MRISQTSANPIYRKTIPRELTDVTQDMLGQNPVWYLKPDGELDIEKLLNAYIKFYKEYSEMVTTRKTYSEAAHHLLFMAWLHRIVNSGERINREYAAGLKRLDLSHYRDALLLIRYSQGRIKIDQTIIYDIMRI